ncbi:MAG: hypothetical protein IKD78_13570 [Bacteroidales bacterium]|nr:hypothetical protein [Bacteroidales bacterium]
MKKNAQYEINFATNTITVTKRFLQASSQIGTPEFVTMEQLRELNNPISVREIHRVQKENRWGYERMEAYLKHVVDSDRYLADYTTVKDACGYMATWGWFKKTFPMYKMLPELDEHNRIMVLPSDYEEDDDRIQSIA